MEAELVRNHTIATEVQNVLSARHEFYRANGLEEDKRRQNYEPATARVNFERRVLRLSSDQQEVAQEAFLKEERQNLRTMLAERYNTSISVIKYKLIDGKLYSPDFSDEPFTDVIKRGYETSLKLGTKEQKREAAEIVGFEKLQKAIDNIDNPVGTKIIVFSPPGLVEGTWYPKRFVDIWEIKEDNQGKRYAQNTRFSTNLDYDGYKKGARNIEPTYFDKWYIHNEHATDEEKIPIDAWFAEYPIQLGTEYNTIDSETLFNKFFEKDYTSMQEQMFAEVLMVCWPLAEYYLSELCKGERDFLSIAESFTAILARADAFIAEREKYGEARSAHVIIRETREKGIDIRTQAAYWCQQEVTVQVSNCGESKGFKRNKYGQIMISYGFENPQQALLNSIAGKSLNTEDESKGFLCPNCGVGWVEGEQCPHCKITAKEWAEKNPDQACL